MDKTEWSKIKADLVPASELKAMYSDFEPFKPFISPHLEVRQTDKYGPVNPTTGQAHKALFATGAINKVEVIMEFEGNLLKYPTQYTLRVADNLHQTALSPDALENYISHSCNPTGRIDFSEMSGLRMRLIATRDIKPGEEITFNYFQTDEGRKPGEEEAESELICMCDSSTHINGGRITGFNSLSWEDKQAMKDIFSPYLIQLLREERLKCYHTS